MILIASQQNETSTHQVMDWLEYLGSEFQKINAIDISNDLNIQISNEKIETHFINTDLNCSSQNAFWYRRWDFEVLMKKHNAMYPTQIFYVPEAEKLFNEMTELYSKIHELGFRKMPEEMYLNWLISLKEERNKYENKNITNFNPKSE